MDWQLSRYPLCETRKRENVATRVVLFQTIGESLYLIFQGLGHCLKEIYLFLSSVAGFVRDLVVPKLMREIPS